LIDPAQIENIRILNKRSYAVCAGGHDVIGIQDGNGIGFEFGDEFFSVINEQSVING
jgi:hypothetical protein